MTESVIRFEKVCKYYGGKPALDDFSLDVYKNEFITIIGSSGCGKTTALKMVNGLNTPDSGKVYVIGKDISGADLIELRRNIGYAIQGTGLFPHMNVWKNIAYVPNLLNKSDKVRTKKAVKRLMDVMGLEPDMAKRYPGELSGGQQQRVGLARALAASPDILLMDEPFGAVDEITRKMLQDEIYRIHKELDVTILFVTHDIREAVRLGSRMLVMDGGCVIQLGSPQEIIASPATKFVEELVKSAAAVS